MYQILNSALCAHSACVRASESVCTFRRMGLHDATCSRRELWLCILPNVKSNCLPVKLSRPRTSVLCSAQHNSWQSTIHPRYHGDRHALYLCQPSIPWCHDELLDRHCCTMTGSSTSRFLVPTLRGSLYYVQSRLSPAPDVQNPSQLQVFMTSNRPLHCSLLRGAISFSARNRREISKTEHASASPT